MCSSDLFGFMSGTEVLRKAYIFGAGTIFGAPNEFLQDIFLLFYTSHTQCLFFLDILCMNMFDVDPKLFQFLIF